MSLFTPLLLSQCMYLLTSGTVVCSSAVTGVVMCKRWCERRSWCSEATYDPNLLQCSNKTKTPLSPDLIVIPVQQHLCGKCPLYHVCLRTRSGAANCVEEDTRESKQAPNTMQKCRGNIRYVKLLKPSISTDVVYYEPFANCPGDKPLTSDSEFDGLFAIDCFKEHKIYYWLMTLKFNRTVSLKRTLSYQVAIANFKYASFNVFRKDKTFKRITVTVDKERITFNSLKKRATSRSNGPDEFVVVLDRVKGRLLLGTRKGCYAMVHIKLTYTACPMVVHPQEHLPILNKLLFDSIRDYKYDFTYEDVNNMMRQCEDFF